MENKKMLKKFKAGYISDSIVSVLNNEKKTLNKDNKDDLIKLNKINGLLQYVSSFDVYFPHKHKLDYQNLNSVLAIINNIITRGLPTKTPKFIEEKFVEIDLIEANKKEYEFEYPKTIKEISFETIFELLHITKPKLDINESNYGGSPEGGEWHFLDDILTDHPYAKQILQSQRDFSTINPKMVGGKRVDFSFEYPYISNQNENGKLLRRQGVILEFDGVKYHAGITKFYDKYRDDAAEHKNFDTLRQTSDRKEKNPEIEKLFNSDIFKIFAKNYNRSVKDYLQEYILIFFPLAVARIQKTIIEYFLANENLLKQDILKIAIIERDVPCGALAIKGLEEIFCNLNVILEEDSKLELPKIELSIYENQEFVIDSKLHLENKPASEKHFKENESEFDIIIDHAILIRSNIYDYKTFESDKSLIVRSSHYFDRTFGNTRRVYCADLLKYKELVERQDDGSYTALFKLKPHINYFIQNIFRKKSYREGQLPIISRALQQEPVIGLLPTGGGKSLTYQLPVLMQPGICLIIDPIKSLMEDQTRVLKNNLIDTCNYINSNLDREEKSKRLIDFRYGETQFLFVSPERFVMEDFREIIQKLDLGHFGINISYCVVDEVHCVSEWGHDFRSTYLMLGKNAQKFSKTKDKKPVSLIGLTATASFDVLADIERELQIQRDDVANAIIMIENTIRPELFFRVIDVTGKDRIGELNNDFKNIGNNLSKLNNEELLEESKKHHKDNFDEEEKFQNDLLIRDENNEIKDLSILNQNDFYSIIFCPVSGQKVNHIGEFINKQGVRYVHTHLTSDLKGFFFAADEDDDITSEIVQKHFEEFTTDKLKHMVCTKAFGMGIDKSDIRSTYHFVYSSSLESLVQEAGRSGRDKKISEANILLSRKKAFRLNVNCLLYENPDKTELKYLKPIIDKFHRIAIRKIIRTDYDSLSNIEAIIENTINNLQEWNGGLVPIPEAKKEYLKNRLKQFITEQYTDRDIHHFFHDNSFRGQDIEVSQFYSLMKEKEFLYSTRLKEIENKYNADGSSLIFNYWNKHHKKRIYIKSATDGNEYGYINIGAGNSLHPISDTLKNVLNFIIDHNEGETNLIPLCEEELKNETLNEFSLEETFNKSEIGNFEFYLTSEKTFPENTELIYAKISQLPNQNNIQNTYANQIQNKLNTALNLDNCIVFSNGNYKSFFFKWFTLNTTYDGNYINQLEKAYNNKLNSNLFIKLIYKIQIEKALAKESRNFWNFILLLEESIDKLSFNINPSEITIRWLRLYFNRNRYKNYTGRLIYRMHSMGFLSDYIIDYQKNNLYKCTFAKRKSINEYVEIIEEYLRRYLSEQTALSKIEELKKRLTKDTLIDNILECLYFLSEFSSKEIAGKRERATDEIEFILNESVTNEKYSGEENWFEQNIYIKEQIYFYFNAKYARRGFKIEGKPYSLLDDSKNQKLNKIDILRKYLGVFSLEGTEQNNYKHMIGSCKKIIRSLPESDLQKEWILHLLKAFAMYAVNNASYIQEANKDLERGFENLYEDLKDKDENIESIFNTYFEKLIDNIKEDNISYHIIRQIRLKLLQKLQEMAIEELIQKNINLKKQIYA